MNYCINKENFKKSFLYTFIIGFIAHGFAYANFQPSHDSLAEAISSAEIMNWKIQLGRYLKPLYDMIFGYFTSFPWTNGIVTLFWLSIVVYLMVEILDLKKNIHIGIVCGILLTNITIISLTATYEHDLGSDMCGLAFAMLGVYVWNQYTNLNFELKNWKTSFVYGLIIACCIMVSLALYQAFICVFVSMVLIISVLRCMDEKYLLKNIWISDIYAAISTIIGGILYYAGLKIVLLMTNISLKQDNYNSVSNAWSNSESIRERIVSCLKQFILAFLDMSGYGVYSSKIPQFINVFLFVLGFVCFIGICFQLIKKKVSICNILSAIFFIILLPFSMNGMRLLNTMVHNLMIYAFWLSYVFIFCLVLKFKDSENNSVKLRWIEKVTIVLLSVLILMNVQIGNAAYVKKATEQEATLSLMTRVVDKVEDLEGYEAGVTPVVFVGIPNQYLKNYDPFNGLGTITGLESNSPITYNYYSYLKMMMRININVVDSTVAYEKFGNDYIEKMSTFPKKDGLVLKDGIVVVKFG